MSSLDFTVIATLTILIPHTWPRLKNVGLTVKFVHFALYALLLRMTLSGLSYFISLCVRPDPFIAQFSEHSKLLVPLAILVSISGAVLTFCLMTLGAFNKKARNVFGFLCVPYLTLFPLIMVKSTDNAVSLSNVIAMMLGGFGLGIFAIYFYGRIMKQQFESDSCPNPPAEKQPT